MEKIILRETRKPFRPTAGLVLLLITFASNYGTIEAVTYRFPNTAVSTMIDMSEEANHKGMILSPAALPVTSPTLTLNSFITFTNLPSALWLSLEYNTQNCQAPPFIISTLGDRKVAFVLDECGAPADAIFTEEVYGSKFIQFAIPTGAYIPKFNLSYHIRANLLTISESPELYLTMAAPTSGYIMSHENFNFGVDRPAAALGEPADTASYTQNDTTGLFMRLPVATTHVNFNFIHYDIGTRDELYIFNAVPDFELLYHGKGTSSPSQNITFNITANEMRFEFAVEVVDAGQPRIFSGFLLQYEVSYCKSDFRKADIVRKTGSSSVFSLHCSDNVTVSEITCTDGRWIGRFLPDDCPDIEELPQISTTSSDTSTQEISSTENPPTSTSALDHTPVPSQADCGKSALTIAAAVVGGIALILIVIVIVQAVIIYRLNHKRDQDDNGNVYATPDRKLQIDMDHATASNYESPSVPTEGVNRYSNLYFDTMYINQQPADDVANYATVDEAINQAATVQT